MTTTTTHATTPAVANGLAPIPFDFQAISAAEVGVLRAGVEQLGGFDVVLNGDSTGTVTPVDSWGADDVLIFSKPSYEQPANFDRFGAFYPDQFNAPFDRIMRSMIAIRDGLGFDRPLGVLERAGYFPVWDAAGRLYRSSGTGNDAALRADLAAAGLPLIGVGSGTSLDNVLSVNAARYGFREAATAAQNLTAITDAIGEHGGGAQPIMIDLPPGAYEMNDLNVVDPNIGINGHGSTLIGTRITFAPAAIRAQLKSLRFYHDTAAAVLTLNSDFGVFDDIEIEKFGAGDGYMAMTEQAYGSVFTGWRFRGGNGMFVEGEGHLLSGIHGIGRAAGGDDFIVFKARNVRTGDIVVVGVYAENYSNVLAFGSEIGTLGANSAARVGRVENVGICGVVGRSVEALFNIKPGAIDSGDPLTAAAYDWRDGLVRGVSIEQAQVFDPTGAKLRRAGIISPARNALVEWPKINLKGTGRFANSADTECWLHIFLPDSTAYAAPGAGGIVRDVDADIRGFDPYAGVDGGGASPGYPPVNGVLIEKQNPAVGTVDRIRLGEIVVDGTKGGGIVCGPSLGAAVSIKRFIGSRLCNNPLATQGGIDAATGTTIYAPGENEISMATAVYKPIMQAGTGKIKGKRITFTIDKAAGAVGNAIRQLPYNAWLGEAQAVSHDAIGASGAAYITLELRALNGLQYDGTALDGGALSTFNTSATAIVALTPFAMPAFPLAGAIFEDRFLRGNTVIRAQLAHTGGGQPFNGIIELDHVQVGPRV